MSFSGLVFPGQGAQKIGMAKDFVDNNAAAAAVFEKANKNLPFDIFQLCHEENELLDQTNYTQPAILVAEIAMFEAIKSTFNYKASYFAGHSLGEYAALVAAGVLPFEIALELVMKRGNLMHHATTGGGMTAIIMDQIPLASLTQAVNQFNVDVANDNSNQQVVISGLTNDVDKAVEYLSLQYQDQSFRAVPLTVSSAFHSRWMQPVTDEFFEYSQQFKSEINSNNLPQVASNYLGTFYAADKDQLLLALANQISGPVQWRKNMELMKTMSIIELGPNRPLRAFFKSIGIEVQSITNMKSAIRTLAS